MTRRQEELGSPKANGIDVPAVLNHKPFPLDGHVLSVNSHLDAIIAGLQYRLWLDYGCRRHEFRFVHLRREEICGLWDAWLDRAENFRRIAPCAAQRLVIDAAVTIVDANYLNLTGDDHAALGGGHELQPFARRVGSRVEGGRPVMLAHLRCKFDRRLNGAALLLPVSTHKKNGEITKRSNIDEVVSHTASHHRPAVVGSSVPPHTSGSAISAAIRPPTALTCWRNLTAVLKQSPMYAGTCLRMPIVPKAEVAAPFFRATRPLGSCP